MHCLDITTRPISKVAKKQTVSVYEKLMAYSRDLPSSHALACMLDSLSQGQGDMPTQLGLKEVDFQALLQFYFPNWYLSLNLNIFENTINTIDNSPYLDELVDLQRLFLIHRIDNSVEREWIANVLAVGCMASRHLWQSLGLWQRTDLSALIAHNFPTLAAQNDKNMKWKKFFYKQLCLGEGVYVCRAPSCSACGSYADCFGPEE